MNDTTKISRRRFLSGAASTAATTCLPVAGVAALAGEAVPAEAQYTQVGASSETAAPIEVVNAGYRLRIDPVTGNIVSLLSTYGIERELLVSHHAQIALLKVELMDVVDGKRVFQTVYSNNARKVRVEKHSNDREQTITIEFLDLSGLPIDAWVTVRCPADETLTYWSLELRNETKQWIGHVQFPGVRVPFDDLTKGDFSHVLCSSSDGVLNGPVTPTMTAGAWGGHERNYPDAWRMNNYPGQWTSTQLMAYYNDAGGLYVACDDATGLPKFIGPLIDDDGVTMGLGHYPGTNSGGKQKLPYNIVLGTFQGDWYRAAEIYREWAWKQPFCARKMSERKDIPKWLSESPVGIAFPMRGQGDWDGPAKENPEYAPATNALPYLEKLAEGLGSSLMPIVFNWEHGGPWVQPDAFPPVGGDAAMREFMTRSKEKGWHPVIYGDGLSWVTGQKNTDYDGMPYFREHGGEAAVVRNWDGTLLKYDLGNWRKGYVACVGTQGGREMMLTMTRKMAEYGPAVVQQFDQGPGPKACYATDHSHPPVPGPWMGEEFKKLLKVDAETARSADAGVAMSCEGAPPESSLQDFQIWDARVTRCPLYSFLYHEYANGQQGFYTNRVSDEALRLSLARAIVTGYMLTLTLRDNGRIAYDWDQPWSRAVPDQAAILDWGKRTNQFRAGIARDYLIYGRMLRPWTVSGVTERDLGWGREPLVPSATWQAADGRVGVVLANASDLGETVRVELQGPGEKRVRLNIDGEATEKTRTLPGVMNLTLAPRSICLIEVG